MTDPLRTGPEDVEFHRSRYRGRGFFFDDDLIAEANRRARQLQTALMLDAHVMVYAGPADTVIRGRRYEQKLLGTIESLTRKG